jgi:hypothetical protein
MTKPFGPNRRHFIALAARLGGLAAGLGMPVARAGDFRGTGIFKGPKGGGNAKCVLRGTRIATRQGLVPVEDIRPGDVVLTSRGEAVEVSWVGMQVLDPARAAGSQAVVNLVWPVRIARHALDDFTPHADLFVSPGHALLLDGVLIPAGELINGVSITQVEPDSGVVEYYNLLLGSHEVILAEGALVETLLLNSADELTAFNNAATCPQTNDQALVPMTPFAPILCYRGTSHVTALLRRAVSAVTDVRDPVQVAYDRIAGRCLRKRAA